MADLEEYLAKLRAELPLPAEQRDETVEEIAGHVADVTTALVERGIPTDEATRQALARLGPPARLADELARAQRTPWNVLEAAGAVVRVTIGTGFWALVIGWITTTLVALLLGSLFRILVSWLELGGTRSFGINRGLSPILGSVVYALVAYSIGRALPPALALAARRRVAVLRPVILAAGGVLAGVIGLFALPAEYGPISVVMTALLPVWFGLGVLRPSLVPRWFPGNARAVGVLLLLVAALLLLPIGLLDSAPGGDVSQPLPAQGWDPSAEYQAIAPVLGPDDPLFAEEGSWSAGNQRTYEWRLVDARALAGWTDLHVEVWLGIGEGNVLGLTALDPFAGRPLASAPVTINDGLLTATFELPAIPERDHYLVALLGSDPAGATWQLTWPRDDLAYWSGTVWEYLTIETP